jgi:hypothetical protein
MLNESEHNKALLIHTPDWDSIELQQVEILASTDSLEIIATEIEN